MIVESIVCWLVGYYIVITDEKRWCVDNIREWELEKDN